MAADLPTPPGEDARDRLEQENRNVKESLCCDLRGGHGRGHRGRGPVVLPKSPLGAAARERRHRPGVCRLLLEILQEPVSWGPNIARYGQDTARSELIAGESNPSTAGQNPSRAQVDPSTAGQNPAWDGSNSSIGR